jgi:hypothetical protein
MVRLCDFPELTVGARVCVTWAYIQNMKRVHRWCGVVESIDTSRRFCHIIYEDQEEAMRFPPEYDNAFRVLKFELLGKREREPGSSQPTSRSKSNNRRAVTPPQSISIAEPPTPFTWRFEVLDMTTLTWSRVVRSVERLVERAFTSWVQSTGPPTTDIEGHSVDFNRMIFDRKKLRVSKLN